MKKQNTSNTRYIWADVIRVSAIFLVVLVHNLFFLPQNTVGTLWMWIPYLYAQLGVPLFVMISGALLLGRDESLSQFFRKRTGRILLPWVFWIGVYVIIDSFLHQKHPGSFSLWLKYLYEMFFSRFWFLPMIFGLYLMTPILKILVSSAKKYQLVYALVLWYAVFAVLPALYKAFGIYLSLDSSLLRQVMQYSGLYVLGYLLTMKQYFQKPLGFWVQLLLSSIAATYVSVFLTSYTLAEQHTDPFFFRIFSPTMIPGVIAVFMLLFLLSAQWERSLSEKKKRFLALVSTSALGIYLVHEIVQEGIARYVPGIDLFLHTIEPLLASPLRAVLVFCLSFIIIAILKKIPLLRLIA